MLIIIWIGTLNLVSARLITSQYEKRVLNFEDKIGGNKKTVKRLISLLCYFILKTFKWL